MPKNFSDNSKFNQNKYKKYIFGLGILAAVLVATNAATAYFWQKAILTTSDVDRNGFNLLNPARNFFKQEDLIINFQPLRDYLNDKYETDPNISIYFEYLPTGANIAISKDAEFWPASMLKVPAAMVVAKKIENGEWKWNNELVLMGADKDERFGDLYKQPTGKLFTIEELIEKSLTESDNTANTILVRNLDPEEITNIYNHIGLFDFFSEQGKISAKRYSVIFRALYNASFLSDENSQKLLNILNETPFKEYLGSGLPDGVRFSHKIGVSDNKEVFLDSGIIYVPNRPYILTVMIKTGDKKYAEKIMKDISEKAYQYVINYSGEGGGKR